MLSNYTADAETHKNVQKSFVSLDAIVFDFDGVFTDNTVRVDQNGTESVSCWRSDGIGLKRLHELKIRTLVLSTEENPVVTVRTAKLQIECIQGVKDKGLALQAWIEQNNIEFSRVAYVGNDINDLSAFKLVGFPIAVSDSYPEILPHVLYRTLKRGGYGAVREVCDLIYNSKTDICSER
jgi:YrbI family 3-deoxy-D-manno-octulosonate 8-phosphate phosphatase